MPRFHFHLLNDHDIGDPEGVELDGLDAARAHAREQLLFTIAETLKEKARIDLSHRIDIEDEGGDVLESVRVADVVEIQD